MHKRHASACVLVLRHVPHVPMGSLEAILTGAGLQVHQVDLFAEIPPTLPLDRASGMVVLGGPMSATELDRYPFLTAEAGWLREAVAREMPVLGICLGAQLLAQALGKRVYRNEVREIGWYDLELLPAAADDPLFAEFDLLEIVFQWHGDTFDLPEGAVHLARTALCPHQAFRCGPRAYGVQFHAEMTAKLIQEWLEDPGFCVELASAPYINPQAILDQLPARLPRMELFCHRLLGRFAALCLEWNRIAGAKRRNHC